LTHQLAAEEGREGKEEGREGKEARVDDN